MPKRHKASSSPRKEAELIPEMNRVEKFFINLRRPGYGRPKATQGPLFSLHLEHNFQGHKRNWSWCSSNSNSSSDDGALSPAAQKENALGKYARDFGFLTPATSPQSSFNDYSDSISTQSSMLFLGLPVEVC
jgi:hypothetical protein